MEAVEEVEQNCGSSNKSNASENCEQEGDSGSVSQDPLNESDKDGNGDSNDMLETEIEKPAEDQNEGDWYDDSDDEEEESEDEDVDESEIDTMLEQGLPKSKRLEKTCNTVEQQRPNRKPVMNLPLRGLRYWMKDENAFEVLPGDWIKVRHSSGLPLYLHRPSRVCTLAKPYYLGPASVRRHSVPLSAIPCLAYRRGLEKEQKDKETLEEQAKELEKPSDDDITSDLHENALEGSKDSGMNLLKKFPTLMAESIAEKVNSMKRKLEEDKERWIKF